MSEGVWDPVIRSTTRWDGGIRLGRELVTDEVVVAAFQPQVQSRPCITIGFSEDNHLHSDLMDESAEQVAGIVLELLDEVQ